MRTARWARIGACTALASAAALAACAPAADYDGEVPTVPAAQTLAFGKTAEVVTQDVRFGVPVVWEVGVAKPKLLEATPTFPEALCYEVTMVPTMVGQHPVDVTVAMPRFTPVAGQQNANYLEDPTICGESNPPHGYTGELEAGQEYTQWVASWDGLYGIAATGVKLTTGSQTVDWK